MESATPETDHLDTDTRTPEWQRLTSMTLKPGHRSPTDHLDTEIRTLHLHHTTMISLSDKAQTGSRTNFNLHLQTFLNNELIDWKRERTVVFLVRSLELLRIGTVKTVIIIIISIIITIIIIIIIIIIIVERKPADHKEMPRAHSPAGSFWATLTGPIHLFDSEISARIRDYNHAHYSIRTLPPSPALIDLQPPAAPSTSDLRPSTSDLRPGPSRGEEACYSPS